MFPSHPPQIPKLCHHKATGRAVVRLNDVDHYLGMFGTPEAQQAYDRMIAEWLPATVCLCPPGRYAEPCARSHRGRSNPGLLASCRKTLPPCGRISDQRNHQLQVRFQTTAGTVRFSPGLRLLTHEVEGRA